MNTFATNAIARFKTLARTIGRIINPAPAAPPQPACGNINALLLHLCDFDDDLHAWVLRWIAYPLRNPGAKMSTCVVVNGQAGTGMSMFFDKVVAPMHGAGARHIAGELLDATFNSWAANARYVVIEGRYSSVAGRLKEWITSRDVIVERKYALPQHDENRMNFVLLSSSHDFLSISASTRRFVVIEAPPKREPRFYQAASEEIKNGGVDAFQHYLMHGLNMGDFDQYALPPSMLPNRKAKCAASSTSQHLAAA